jgi:hypothetical protein
MLGQGAAVANQPYTAYGGPLTAGPSSLQTQAFQGLGALKVPTSGSFTDEGIMSKYMNPFVQGAIDPQVAAARREAQLSQLNLQGKYGKAGAYGGSRQGVAEAELQRGLLDRVSGIYGTGYENAYKQAQDQFNTEQQYGMDVLDAQLQGGTTQQAIEQAGITADKKQFEEERDYPKQQLMFMQSLLQGLPLETQSYSSYEPSGLQSLAGGSADMLTLLQNLNLIPKTPAPAPAPTAGTTQPGGVAGTIGGTPLAG